MENAFYCISKVSFVVKIFDFFVLTFLFMQGNHLIRKLMLIQKYMTSQTGKQIITIHILPNISRNKIYQTMKVGHLIEYNIRNIFLEKSNIKCDGETSARPFSKKSKFSKALDQQCSNFYAVCFYCVSRFRTTKIY